MGTPGNWTSSIVADGANQTANFTNSITADRTVNLTADQTIGNINSSDNGAFGSTWIVDSTTANKLILSGTTPTITTLTGTTINAVIDGTDGLTKAGASNLILAGPNTFSGGLTLNTGTLRLGNNSGAGVGTLTIKAGTTMHSVGSRTLSNAVTVDGNFTIYALTGNIHNFSGPVTLTGSRTISLNTDAAQTISGAVGDGGSGYGLAITGLGGISRALILSNSNTYSGATTITGGAAVTLSGSNSTSGVTLNSGSVVIGNNSALGTGTFVINGGQVQVVAGASRTVSNAATIGGNFTFFANTASDTLTIGGATTITGATRSIHFNAANAAPLTFSAAIGDGGGGFGITKNGSGGLFAGTLVFNGNNTYTGPTTVNNGLLRVNGTTTGQGNFTVATGATLDGTGTIGLASGKTLTVNSGGKLAPGNSIGTLTVTGGNVIINGQLNIELNSSSTDLLQITSGALDLSSGTDILDITKLSGSLTGTYVLATATGGVIGTFDTVKYNGSTVINPTAPPNAFGGAYHIAYTSNSVLLLVPEPASLALALAGGVLLIRRQGQRA